VRQGSGKIGNAPLPDIELTRVGGDRRLFVLPGVGTLRFQGLLSRAATADAEGRSWRFGRRGFWQRDLLATDAGGATVGDFTPNTLRRGGPLHWNGRELTLRPASAWRERYALSDGERELAVLDAKSWGKQPVKVTVHDLGAVEPALLLFAAFVVRGLAEDTAGAAAAGATAASSG
jgi:hypothetical protein